MASFLKKSQKPKKTRKEVAHQIIVNAKEKVDDSASVDDVAGKILEEAQEYITRSSDATRIGELSQVEREKAVELLKSIAKVLADSDKIPDAVTGEFIKNLIQNDSKAVGVAVAENAEFIPDDQLKKIIDMDEVGINDAQRIVPGIEDDETRARLKERIDFAKLREIYEKCDEFQNDSELIHGLSKIINNYRDNEKFNEIIKRIVAKRVAYNYKNLKAITINRYIDIISPVQMLDENIIEVIKREYRAYEENSKDNRDFDSETCKMMIIDELAKSIVNQYFEQSPDNRVIVIPESPAIRAFKGKEEEHLIDQIRIRCENKNEPLKKYQIQKIRNEIHGYIKTEQVESLTTTLESITNPDTRREFASIFERILEMIQEFPENEQIKIMELIVTITEKTTDKVRTMKGNEGKKTAPQAPQGEGR